ncbi:hypothetical protein [Paraburkholderia ferrariae]|uniref:hypothetical protein n=1 Tax=Paraburkholderia ferrariae TaxID=386056 RepID=UPI000AD8032A|nr:hypothetical protein [Paraburkholderia ferrariae]
MKINLYVAAILLAVTMTCHAAGTMAGGGAHAPAGQPGAAQHTRPKMHHAR